MLTGRFLYFSDIDDSKNSWIKLNLECCQTKISLPDLENPDLSFPSCRTIPADFVECLQGKTTSEIQREAWKIRQVIPEWKKLTTLIEPFCPTYNSATLENEPFFLYKEGKIHDKPFIMDVANEGLI